MDADELIKQIEDVLGKKLPMSPSYWLEQAEILNILSSDETDLLTELAKKAAYKQLEWVEQGKSMAESELRLKTTDEYMLLQKQKAKVEKIKEIIRLAKTHAKLKNEEYRENF
jgi:hypothetical protein